MGDYAEVESDEWVKPVMEDYKMKCCDCGLVHELDFKVVKRVDEECVEDVSDKSLQVMFRARRESE